jgi:hypothetical protein
LHGDQYWPGGAGTANQGAARAAPGLVSVCTRGRPVYRGFGLGHGGELLVRRGIGRVAAAWQARGRVSDEPSSGNGASSFHLLWDLPQVPLTEVAVTLEVVVPPIVPRLYFWALQVSFASSARLQGGAHLGLQWNPRHPGGTAVCWGGYGPGNRSHATLDGTESAMPGLRGDPNTRHFSWVPGHRYRLRVSRVPGARGDGVAWRGTVTDLEEGVEWVVRDLFSRGEYLFSPMVWSEVFARCELPSASVRWSDLEAKAAGGETLRPHHVRVNYQTRAEGGCANTTVVADGLGILQITSVERQVPQAAVLPVPPRGPLP